MVRPRILKNPKVVPVTVESAIYEEVMKCLPRDVSFADKVREWMLKELESVNMEKNEQPPTDPLNLSRPTTQDVLDDDNDTITLDLYQVSEKEVMEHMFQLIKTQDWKTVRMLNPKAVIINERAIMAFKILNQMTEEKSRLLKSIRNNDPKEYHAYFNTVFDEGG